MNIFFKILIFLFTSKVVFSQSLEGGFIIGSSQYKGDLADNGEGLFENLKMIKGLTLTYEPSARYNVSMSFVNTNLEAWDKNSKDPSRRLRNLHFKSPLNEFSFSTEIYPISFFTKSNSFIKPYIKTGVGFFTFNPKASYNGSWYELQPLRTEGQGMPGSENNPYYLIDVSHLFGMGLRMDFGKFSFKLEIAPRNTSTDYIDDVSGKYYDLTEIRKNESSLAAMLSYREVEWDIEDEAPRVEGQIRGNSSKEDWYVIQQFTVSYTIFKKKEETAILTNTPTLEVIK